MRHLAAFVLIACLLPPACSPGEGGRPAGPPDFPALARKVKPWVVSISAQEVREGPLPELFYRFFGQDPPREMGQRQLGSGVVIKSSGLIVTSFRLIDGADRIRVSTIDGTGFPAEVVKGDAGKDLALLRVEATGSRLTAAVRARGRRLRVGEWVMAVGNPFGLEHTITLGVVSALDRRDIDGQQFDVGLIQTDASINPGNYGGPLINTRGEVVGVKTAASDEGTGIGFAVPVRDVERFCEDYL